MRDATELGASLYLPATRLDLLEVVRGERLSEAGQNLFVHVCQVVAPTNCGNFLMLPPYSSPRPSRNKPPGPLMAPAALVRPAAS